MTNSKRMPCDYNKVTNNIKGTRSENINVNHRKERNPSSHIQVILKNDPHERATITVDVFYPSTNAGERVYACVWINDTKTGTYLSGSDYAGGYGYCKYSGSIDSAITNAGIEMTNFGGCGRECVTHAMVAIMSALGYRRNQYIIAKR